MERKNENSRADARDIPAICPPAMVDIDRDVPGNTAERIWQAPIQSAWPVLMASIFQVRMRPAGAFGPADSALEFIASTSPITAPPTNRETPITIVLSRFAPMTLFSRNAGTAVTTKAMHVRPSGCDRKFR